MSGAEPLRGRTALVTGSGRGIGAESARVLAAMGAAVVVTYRSDRAQAEALCADLRAEHHVPAHALAFDLAADEADPASATGLLAEVAAVAGAVDVLVVNAAAPYPQVPLRELTAAQLVTKVSQDVGSAHLLVTGVAPAMLERGYGRIVLIGSLHADGPTAPGMAASGVSKAALAAYVAYAVDELTGPGVTVNLLHPGYVSTEASSHLPAAVPATIAGLTPSGRAGTPRDVAGAVSLLVREEAGFVNGSCLPVAGGLNHPVPLRRLPTGRS